MIDYTMYTLNMYYIFIIRIMSEPYITILYSALV